MADWEKDIWKKVYFTVGRKAVFQYTHEKSEAQDKNFENNLGEIHSTVLKTPKRGSRAAATDEDLTKTTNDTITSATSSTESKRSKTQDVRKK